MNKYDLKKYLVKELKPMLEKRNLDTKGLKTDLIESIEDFKFKF